MAAQAHGCARSNGASEPRAASVESAPDDQRRTEQRFRLEQSRQRVGGRELRAVEQGEALLRRERDRRQADLSQRLRGRRYPVADARLADADHRRRQVSERREIAGGADRALRRHDRRQSARQHRFDEAKRLGAHAGSALRKAAELQRHHQPHRFDGGRLADAGGVGEHDVALQLREIRGRDAHARELAEAGVDAIDRRAAIENARDRRGARRDARLMRGIERDRRAAPDRAPVGERSRAGFQRDGHRPLQTRACNGLKPRR